MTYYRIAYVYVRKVFTGVLSVTDYGYSFKYDEEYLSSPHATAVSLTLPLRKEEYKSHFLFPFFDGLIPEGWLLNIVVHNWKIESNDRFGILLVACHDTIGNVSIWSNKI